MRSPWRFVAALSAFVGAREANAFAEPAQAVALQWTHGPGCIEEQALAGLVEQTLGQRVFHRDAPPAAMVDGRIERVGGVFRAHITLRAPSGETLAVRDLETAAESCDRVDESLAVVIALMIDALPPQPPSSPSPPSAATPTPSVPPIEPARIVVPSRPRERPELTIAAEAGLVASVGVLPRATAGAYLRAGLGGEALSIAIHSHAWLPSRALENGAGADIWAWAAALDACAWPFRPAHWRFGACLGVGGGWMTGTPIGLAPGGPGPSTLPWGFAVGSLDIMGRVTGQLWGHMSLSGWCPFVVPTYFYHRADGTQQDLFRPWVVSPSVAVGLVARAP